MLLLSGSDVSALLPVRECMDVMAAALAELARGNAILPLRLVLRLPDSPNAFAVMPAYLGASELPAAAGLKAITVCPGNEGTRYESHQGAVLLFEAERGRLLAVMDASAITAIRTAAVSGVATRLLAREDAGDLAILGSGTQAATHLEAMVAARPVRRVRAWSRSPARLRRFAEAAAQRGLTVECCDTAREAVAGADLICTTTASREPVLLGDWIAPGAHVNAVGASTPAARELDTTAVLRARLFVDRRESALAEAGEFLTPKREGVIGDGHIRAELGELLLGERAGRRSPDEITLFKSLGLAVEDLAAARHLYAAALARGAGTTFELGGTRDDAGHH